jgi:hypothetical protein
VYLWNEHHDIVRERMESNLDIFRGGLRELLEAAKCNEVGSGGIDE